MDFEKWKGEFSVDAEGTTEEVEEGKQGLLSDFVDYVKVLDFFAFLSAICCIHLMNLPSRKLS